MHIAAMLGGGWVRRILRAFRDKLLCRLNGLGLHEFGTGAQIDIRARLLGRPRIRVGAGSRVGAYAYLEAGHPHTFIQIGENCRIEEFARLSCCGGPIVVGDNCSVNPYSILYGSGGLTIGNGVRIAGGTVIIPANHKIDRLDIPIHMQGLRSKGIVIEDDVWIGANVTILDGSRIGSGSVVAAGAVVTKDVEPFSIVGGVPATLIRKRK